MNKMLSLLRTRTNSLNKSGLIRPYSLLRIFDFFWVKYHRCIKYRWCPIGYWALIIDWWEFRQNFSNITEILAIYRFRNEKIECGETRGAMEEDYKKIANFFKISTINRWFFGRFFKFPLIAFNGHIWIFDDPMTQILPVFFIKASNSQICYPMVENQSWFDPTTRKCF